MFIKTMHLWPGPQPPPCPPPHSQHRRTVHEKIDAISCEMSLASWPITPINWLRSIKLQQTLHVVMYRICSWALGRASVFEGGVFYSSFKQF